MCTYLPLLAIFGHTAVLGTALRLHQALFRPRFDQHSVFVDGRRNQFLQLHEPLRHLDRVGLCIRLRRRVLLTTELRGRMISACPGLCRHAISGHLEHDWAAGMGARGGLTLRQRGYGPGTEGRGFALGGHEHVLGQRSWLQ